MHGTWMLRNFSSPLMTQASNHPPNPTDESSLWGTRDPDYPHSAVLVPPNTPHLSSFPIQRRKASGFQPVHSRCGAQRPTTQEAPLRAGHENPLLRNSHTSDPIHHLTPAQREHLGNVFLSIFRDLMLLVGNWDISVMAKFLREWELRELLKSKCYNFTCTLGMLSNLPKTWPECLLKSLTLPISLSEAVSSGTFPFSTWRTAGLGILLLRMLLLVCIRPCKDILEPQLSVIDCSLAFPKSTDFSCYLCGLRKWSLLCTAYLVELRKIGSAGTKSKAGHKDFSTKGNTDVDSECSSFELTVTWAS